MTKRVWWDGREVESKHTISIIKLEISEIGKNKHCREGKRGKSLRVPFLAWIGEISRGGWGELATGKIHKKILILLHQFTIRSFVKWNAKIVSREAKKIENRIYVKKFWGKIENLKKNLKEIFMQKLRKSSSSEKKNKVPVNSILTSSKSEAELWKTFSTLKGNEFWFLLCTKL